MFIIFLLLHICISTTVIPTIHSCSHPKKSERGPHLLNLHDKAIQDIVLNRTYNSQAPETVPVPITDTTELVQFIVAWQELPFKTFINVNDWPSEPFFKKDSPAAELTYQKLQSRGYHETVNGLSSYQWFIKLFDIYNPGLQKKLLNHTEALLNERGETSLTKQIEIREKLAKQLEKSVQQPKITAAQKEKSIQQRKQFSEEAKLLQNLLNRILSDDYHEDPMLGGGTASCGYHPLKNALIFARAIYDADQNAPNTLHHLLNLSLVDNLFGTPLQQFYVHERLESGAWRKYIIDHNPYKPAHLGGLEVFLAEQKPNNGEWLTATGIEQLWEHYILPQINIASGDAKEFYKHAATINIFLLGKGAKIPQDYIKNFTQSPTFLGAFVLNPALRHWILLMVNKVGNNIQFMIADSNNEERYHDPLVLQVIQQLTGHVPSYHADQVLTPLNNDLSLLALSK